MEPLSGEASVKMKGGFFDVITRTGQSYSEHPNAEDSAHPLKPATDRLYESDLMVSTIQTYPTGEDVQKVY